MSACRTRRLPAWATAAAAVVLIAAAVCAPAHAWQRDSQDGSDLPLSAAVGDAAGALPAGSTSQADAETAGDPNRRQLLVMLRLPAPHYRPDATYGGRYMDDNGNGARRRRAEALAREHGLTLVESWPMSLLGIDCYVMQYGARDDPQQLIARLSRDPQVEWAQTVARFDGMAQVPDAAAADAADALYQVQPAARYWHVADLHRYATGREVRVAVVDSGIDGDHPDLAGQLAVNANFVDAGAPPPELHGTAVAGIIAARSGNGGIVGVAPRARLMGLRACWQTGSQRTRCNSFTLSKALNYAILNNAKIINLSLSGPPDKLLDRLLDVALERGISVVGAIDPQGEGPAFPASHRGVLAVASQPRPGLARTTELRQAKAEAGAMPGLLAPGNDIPTTSPGARWSFVNGSSYAAAHVSGMLALLEELRPDASPTQLRTMLQPVGALKAANIDACATISRLIRQCSCSCPVPAIRQAPLP
ncbi:peptidase S8 and S53 subtilisin kexin sedolisin [Duganella sp. Leaf126]|uniref:S8 family peptidase n=1 Tax=Duganella sp. Leaf126 TaxID=1736266 RepID=UPI0006F6C318|nr:S8 family serine peptidase [Duganella sp. Leaf126]KQQ36023.1 peptidase S8 and S53 subtilisin kexin sedolisin [Duganella sp. Leaf126]